MANAYQKLVSAKAAYCKGKKTKAQVNKAKSAYIKYATAKTRSKPKTKTEATRIAKRVLARGCKMTSAIAGARKRKATRRRRTKK